VSSTFTIKRGDTGVSLEATLKIDGAAVNLTGVTSVKFYMRDTNGATSNKVDGADATVTDAAGGVVQYDWEAADVDAAGTYIAEFRVIAADGKPKSYPDDGFITVTVKNGLA
jgi:hypothetical protein